MNKIDAILNGVSESVDSKKAKLERIIMPFALLAMGQTPVYFGCAVRTLGVEQCKDCNAFIFSINDEQVAHVDTERMEASVFGGEVFPILKEDAESVNNTVVALESHKSDNHDIDKNSIKDIIESMPKELKSILGAAILASKLRRDN